MTSREKPMIQFVSSIKSFFYVLILSIGWTVLCCGETNKNNGDDAGTDASGFSDVDTDADTDADTDIDNGTRCIGDVEPKVPCGTGVICPEEECCNDQGNFCDSQSSCCPNGCMPIGGECCGEDTYCDPGFECVNDGQCQPIGGGDADADADTDTDTDGPGSTCGQYSCEQLHQCMGECFQLPQPTECLDKCLVCGTVLSNQEMTAYYNCVQGCEQPNVDFSQCCDFNCRQEITQCFGDYDQKYCIWY